MQVYLIDGTYELFRMYYGVKDSVRWNGQEVGAVRALMRSILKLLREEASFVGVAFDKEIESFRNGLFDGYKTGEGMPDDLWTQFPLAEEGMDALGVVNWPMTEFEADDALASAAAKYAQSPEVQRVLIASPDKDLCQCVVEERVITWDRRRDIYLGREGVINKFGVPPESIPDYLGLVGDAADGIPGLSGWGAKSTATILSHFGHIESIPDDAEKWEFKVRSKPKLAKTLADNREDALLYKKLATLRTDAPIPESLEEIEWRGADRKKLEAFCAKIGDKRLIDRVHLWRD